MQKGLKLMEKECLLYDRACIKCYDCEKCDLDSTKRCNNCEKCLEQNEEYRSVKVEDFIKKRK
ncbi:hypothetical protein [Pseudobacteroides cellulosolvens]|nr:hypothetical protein [Pseudobacteroides cellulosolvens]